MLKDYYSALGEFVDQFAKTENFLFWTLHIVSGIELPVFNAFLSGTRARTAISYFKRLYETRDSELPPWLMEAFSQFATINTERDLILHSGVTPDRTFSLVVSNKDRAHVARAIRSIPVTPDTLADMTTDLEQVAKLIELWLMLCESDRLRAKYPSQKIKITVAPNALEKALHRSWLYKPSQLVTNGRGSHSPAPAPSPRPKASPK